ncbi:MAG: YciI family protein [Acidobacteriota bacterium]
MQYLFLIYADEVLESEMTEAEMGALLQNYGKYSALLESRGVLRAGEGLQPSTTATSIRVRNDDTLITDGPFAETKEQLGGFYLVDCASLDEALELAAQIPSANYGTVEVRPVMDYSQLADD